MSRLHITHKGLTAKELAALLLQTPDKRVKVMAEGSIEIDNDDCEEFDIESDAFHVFVEGNNLVLKLADRIDKEFESDTETTVRLYAK